MASHQIFIGGKGDDTYKINVNGVMTIFDGGAGDFDQVQASGIGLNFETSYVATVEGRHFYAFDMSSAQGICVLDFLFLNLSNHID